MPAPEYESCCHLTSERDRHAVPDERDLVLDERGQQRRVVFCWSQRKSRRAREVLVSEPVTGAGHQILTPADAAWYCVSTSTRCRS